MCVATWKPAWANRSIALASRSGSGQNGFRPSPWVSGSSSQAVPLSITPSAKNFTTPPRHSRPRTSRSGSCASISSSVVSGVIHSGTRRRIVSSSVPSRSRSRSYVAGSPSITCAPVSPSEFSRCSSAT